MPAADGSCQQVSSVKIRSHSAVQWRFSRGARACISLCAPANVQCICGHAPTERGPPSKVGAPAGHPANHGKRARVPAPRCNGNLAPRSYQVGNRSLSITIVAPAYHRTSRRQGARMRPARRHGNLAHDSDGYGRLTIAVGAPARHRSSCRQGTRMAAPRCQGNLTARRNSARHGRLSIAVVSPACHCATRRQRTREEASRRHGNLAACRDCTGHGRLTIVIVYGAPTAHRAYRRHHTCVVAPSRHRHPPRIRYVRTHLK